MKLFIVLLSLFAYAQAYFYYVDTQPFDNSNLICINIMVHDDMKHTPVVSKSLLPCTIARDNATMTFEYSGYNHTITPSLRSGQLYVEDNYTCQHIDNNAYVCYDNWYKDH
ncbi:hypothetical protein BC940DRAFT_301664 [Gongronella butleri]|nr:hypothetical protein BC940DRAFT_301664 [Gongronella butleri]